MSQTEVSPEPDQSTTAVAESEGKATAVAESEGKATGAAEGAAKATAVASARDVTLTLADIEAGLSALPRAKVARFISIGGALGVIGLVAYRWLEGRDRTSLVIIAVVLLGLLYRSRNPAGAIAKRVYESLPDDAKNLSIAVDEAGFQIRSSGQSSQLPWADVQRCVESRNVFVVFVSQNDAQILPKRAFSEGELSAIRGWSKTKIRRRAAIPAMPILTPELRTRIMIWLVVFAMVWTVFTYFSRQ